MRKLVVVLAIISAVTLVLSLGVVFADGEDTETQTSTATLLIPHTAHLEISNATPSRTLNQDGDSETAFDAGYVDMDSAFPTLTVTANKNWKLSAKVTSPFAANGTYVKAVSDLQVKNAAASHSLVAAFTSLSSSADLDLASNAVGVKLENHPCQYRILLNYTKDIPGTYTATVTYTLVTIA